MNIVFSHPAYAALLLLLALLWFVRRDNSRVQFMLRSLGLILITVGLMEPVLLSSQDSRHQVVIIDHSDSMSAASKREALSAAQQLIAGLDDAPLDVIVLAEQAPALDVAGQQLTVSPKLSLSQAVAQGLAMIPYGQSGSINLFSDGLARDDHWQALLAAMQVRNVSLNWVKFAPAAPPPGIADISYSPFVSGTQPELTIRLASLTNGQGDYVLQVRQAQQLSARQPLSVDAPAPFYTTRLKLPVVEQAFSQYQLELLDAAGTVLDSQPLVLAAQDPMPVLLGAADAAQGEQLQNLLGPAFKVSQAPFPWDDSLDVAPYAAIMLNDVSQSDLSTQAQQNIRQAVQNGSGLLYTGSDYAFGKNGLSNSLLAEMLPVSLAQSETKREPGISLAIIIDSSGSMQGKPLALAKQVARLAVRKLKPQDQVGIVEFYGTRQWAVPMQAVTDTEELERAIGRLQAQGGSELFPAIEEAYFGLKGSHNKYRHILLITDAAVEEQNYQKLLQYIASDQINVSTVLVGDNASGEQKMAELANWGRGRFYAIYDEFSMVELNLRRAQTLPAANYLEGQFSINDAVNQRVLPFALSAYSKVPLKTGAQSDWQLVDSQDSVLASWQYASGKVAALMTEPFGKGTAGWQQWPDYGQQLGSLLASLGRFANQSALDAERVFDKVYVQFNSGQHHSTAQLRWRTSQDNDWQTRPLRLRAPGLFTAELQLPRDQAVLLSASDGQRASHVALAAFSDQRSEQQLAAGQVSLLARVVDMSGGISVSPTALASLNPGSGQTYTQASELKSLLWLAALILYVIELIYRRWPKRRVFANRKI